MKKWILSLVMILAISICANAQEKPTDDELIDLSPTELIKMIKPQIDQTKFESGKLQSFILKYKTKTGGDRGRAIGIILIEVPPAKVQEILDNCNRPEYIPACEDFAVRYEYPQTDLPEGIQRRRIIEQTLKIGLFKPVMALEFTLHDDKTEEYRLITKEECEEWKQRGVNLKPPFWGIKDIGGFGYLEPYANGEKTRYIYSPIVETTIPIPGPILNTIAKLALPGYMEGLKKKAESNGTYIRKGYKKK
jgi:hypothetical protein